MLKQLKSFFEQNGEQSHTRTAPDNQQIAVAATALLVQVAHIDQKEDPRELQAILDCASKAHGMTAAEAKEILEDALSEAGAATSLYEFTELINERFDQEHKQTLLTNMWQVAFADGRIDKYEEHLIRRVADLLHLNHREFILARHNAEHVETL